MNRDEEVLVAIRELAKVRGKTISLSSIYRNVAAKGVYTNDFSIRNSLKRLETRGKIKATGMDRIELLEQ